ncbi:protein-glutamate methylesterase/protein-glutamine glutaminase [Ilumatobacter sp.]|uniref:protein-glutamate methylesterase/protein-glutamine glutaminase n=1 Tax=Ilumatobacter sp. TaxID=1967498 RepID=UPI003B52CA5B
MTVGPARIVVVDDSTVIRGLLSRFIDADPALTVVTTAANGQIGVDKVRAHDPDLVVLDVEMPVMDGLRALREIRRTHPALPVIMFSTLTGRGAATTIEALAAGASDYAAKPTATGTTVDAMGQVRDELLSKIHAILGSGTPPRAVRPGTAPVAAPTPAPARAVRRSPAGGVIEAIVIGSSTGGPVALEQLLTSVAVPFPIPVFVVQHMPPNFTKALADRLDRKTPHRVIEASDGIIATAGTVHIAPGGRHLRLERRPAGVTLTVDDGPARNSCRPSVDPLFDSAAEVYGSHVVAVMLTGMGADGTAGTRCLADRGCDVIAQDERSSTVWGMPRSVVEAGLATEVLPLDRIGERLAQLVRSRSSRVPVAPGGAST